MHTTAPVPSAHLITPYTSVITPSSTYLADPLNSYAHLGMPKPFVHLMGPPLDLTLDARISGDNGRFVRSGCKPNAVLRPVLCKPDPTKKQYHSPEDPDLTFGVFALRDLKANEEVVLGWEWDDGHAVHALPALIEQPTAFPLAPLTSCPPSMFSHSPSLLNHLRNQMTSILHALSSTFTTCACGSSARDCALAQMAAFVDGQLPDAPEVKPDLGPLIGVERGFRTRERVPSGGMSGMEMDYPTPGPSRSAVEDVADAFRASNSQLSGRLSTPERGKTLSVPALTLSPATASPSPKKDRKGKRRAWGERPAEDAVSMDMWTNEDGDDAMRLDTSLGGGRRKHTKLAVIIDSSPTGSPRHPRHHTPDAMHVDEEDQSPRSRGDLHGLHPEREMSMPLKMRKRWLRQTKDEIGTAVSNASPSTTGGAPHGPGVVGDRVSIPETERMDVDMQPPNPSDMPPPPMPAYLDPTTVKSTSRSPAPDVQVSPSTSFANLSLQSPVVRGPSPRSRSSYSPPRESMPSRLFLPTPEPSVEPLPRIDTSRLPPIDNFSPDPSTLLPSPLAPRARSDSPEELRHLPSLKRDDPTFRSPQSATPPPESSHSSTNADIMPEDNGISYRAISLDRSQEPISSDPNSEHGRSSNHEPVPEPVTEPAPPRVPTPPPPPPKVKLSLKDFALRKKKQREEEIAKAVSPSTATHDDESVPTTPQLNGGSIPALDALSNGHDVKTDSPTVDAAQTRNGDTTMAPDSIPTVELVAFKSHEAEAEAETDKARVENKETSVAPASPRRAASLNDPPVKMTICDSTPASVDESNADAKLTGPTSPLPSNGNGNGVTPSDPHPPPASLQAKIEVLDEPIPNGLVAAAEHTSRGRAFSPELPPPLDFAKARRPSAPSPNPSISDRRPSREDGEILPSPPPSKPLSFAPRSHTPPTQPRSFQISPGPLSTPSPRRSSLPYTNPAARPLPSGPRALRGVNAMGHSTSLYPPSRPAYSGSQFIPRGPSADRDRGEWDRERGPWSARGRGGRGGWR
ncbi:hypothetical protein PLICRDRAFT_58008 [Plicaturopsis crispa FD-325 SS-3]|uniref:SET domain-containing protein n=1 Tax=Plicaturopsis crispa FD-325 SS-3 TaxID=944288 RepID=A0A0C9SX93_PLICR|nr:hypothetical protein PLICRDRAFT_58008 [Plicaturopsis crispa FD-325 SS-3]